MSRQTVEGDCLVSCELHQLDIHEARFVRRGAEIGVCGTCMDARGITETELAEGAQRGTMAQLAEWTLAADKVLVF